MALFSKKTTKKETKAVTPETTSSTNTIRASRANILRHARITEKATMHAMDSVYVFEVAPYATKRDVVEAIRDIYQVIPRMVRIAKIPSKPTRSMKTGIVGVKRGGKKAYVYLKKGETITIS